MCGIVGVHTANKFGFYANDRDALKGMLVVNSLRGIHSTGIMGFHKEDNMREQVNIVKSVGSPFNLFEWDRTDDFLSRMVASMGTVVGHGRYATRGGVNAVNAHPFEEGHIVLVHNGGISNFHQLKDNKKHEGIEVDSHLVARLISEEGAEDVLPTLRGAYTLVWYDTTDGTLHMARNAERPLFMGENKDNLFFASEYPTVWWASARYNLKLEKVESLPTFSHFIFEKGSIEPEVIEYKEKHIYLPPQKYNHNDNDYYTPRRQAAKLTNQDQAQMAQMKASTGLSIGDDVAYFIEDFRDLFSGDDSGKLIVGYNENYPNVEFAVASSLFSDNDLISATRMLGKISRVIVIPPTVAIREGVRFRAFLTDFALEEPKAVYGYLDKEKEWVQMKNLADEVNPTYSMATHRLRHLSKDGCGWCTDPITEAELAHPEQLGLWEFGKEIQIICKSCAKGYHTHGEKTTH